MKKSLIIAVAALIIGFSAGYLFFTKNHDGGEEASTGKFPPSPRANNSIAGHKEQLWTCSMHPQIKQKESGDCPICGMELIPENESGEVLAQNRFKMSKNAMALANIQTITVGGEGALPEDGIKLSGTIKIDEDRTFTQPAHFNGRIEKLYVKSVGEHVGMGQPIAEVYSPALVAAQQELITTYKIREQQPQLYSAVRKKFKNWMIQGPVLDKIAKSGEVETRFKIYSHVSGTVTDIQVNQGAHIMDAMPIFSVADLNTVWASFDVYENQISRFAVGQEIEITAKALPGTTLTGSVSFIDPVLDQGTRTVELRVTLNNTKGELKPGMFVTGTFTDMGKKTDHAITIPASAVLWTGERSLVYVKINGDNPIFEMRKILLGARVGDRYQVLEGLQGGEEIVTNGTFTVDAAAQLQGKKSMMNPGKTHTTTVLSTMKIELSTGFQNYFQKVLNHYFKMKDALVQGSSGQVSASAKILLDQVDKLAGYTENSAVQDHLSKITTHLKALASQKGLEEQRTLFIHLNQNLIPIAINLKEQHQKIYIQKCPMANNNQGAYWLSMDKEIKNPYYGKEMIGCGRTIPMDPVNL